MSRTSRRSSNATRTTIRDGQPYVDGVEWLVIPDESTGLAMYRTGQLDCGPGINWAIRQQDLESLKKSHPHLRYQDYLSQTGGVINMRTDMPPFNDVRVRRAISHAIDRQALIEAVWGQGAPTSAVARGLAEWTAAHRSARRGGEVLSVRSPRRPGVCWRKPDIPRALRRSSR